MATRGCALGEDRLVLHLLAARTDGDEEDVERAERRVHEMMDALAQQRSSRPGEDERERRAAREGALFEGISVYANRSC